MTRARDLASGQNGIRPFAIAAGFGGGNNANVVITFPTGRFTQEPRVGIFSSSISALATPVVPYFSAKSASSMTVQIKTSGDGANIGYFDWVAVQMTSTSGSG